MYNSAVKITILFLLSLCLTVQAQQEDYSKEKKEKSRSTYSDKTHTRGLEVEKGPKPDKKWDWAKARMGGNLSLAFGSGQVFIDASPTFGYRVHERIEVGAGYKIFYFKDDNVLLVDRNGFVVGSYAYNDFIHGPLAYSRVYVWEGVHVHAQYEMANKQPFDVNNPNDRINVHHLLLGAGYSSSIGKAGQINLSLLYNVLDQKESIYQFGTFGSIPLFLNISFGFGIGGR